jgi:hypothetical protein
MKTSCISWPKNKKIMVIREDQVEICGGNICAAALLSFFEYWHNIRMEMVSKSTFLNEVAVEHGEEGCHDASLYQFHTMDELNAGIMGLYKRDAIKVARKILKELGIITEHRNPSNRYKFDNTVYYLFHPEIIQEWLSIRYDGKASYRTTENRHIDKMGDDVKASYRYDEKPTTVHLKTVDGAPENRGTITEITTKTSSVDEERSARARKTVELPEWINRTAWEEFEQSRKEIKKPLTDLGRAKAVKILEGHSYNDQQTIIDYSINGRYAGLFPDCLDRQKAGRQSDRPDIDWQDMTWADGMDSYQIGQF